MAAQAAIYLPREDVDLREVFPKAASDKSLFRKASYFGVELNGETVRFNVMPKGEVPGHLAGLQRYIASLPDEAERKAHVRDYAATMRTVLGLVAQSDFDANPAIWQALFQIADQFDGFVFAYSSVILANGTVVVGPLREDLADSDEQAEGEIDEGDEPDDNEEPIPPAPERVAKRALVMCAVVCRGFSEADAGEAPAEEFRQSVAAWVNEMGCAAELEEHERELLHAPLGTADPRAVVNATWSSEGLAVLAWALGHYELPPYDVSVDPVEVANTLRFKSQDARAVVDAAALDPEKIEALQQSIFTVHWRLRQYQIKPEPLDFADFAKTAWFGPLSLDGVQLVDGDLAIGGLPISRVSEAERAGCASIVQERHRALNWLLGWHPIYSEVDTST